MRFEQAKKQRITEHSGFNHLGQSTAELALAQGGDELGHDAHFGGGAK